MSVCSNWADRFPSTVTDVQLSGHVVSWCVPWLIIGSIVKQCPGRIAPIALLPFLGGKDQCHVEAKEKNGTGIVRNIGRRVEERIDAVPAVTPNDAQLVLMCVTLDDATQVAVGRARAAQFDGLFEAFPCGIDEVLRSLVDVPDKVRLVQVRMDTVIVRLAKNDTNKTETKETTTQQC